MSNEQTATTTITNVVEKAREKARLILRAFKINEIKNHIVKTEGSTARAEKAIPGYEKEVARAVYAHDQLDENNPDYEDMKEKSSKRVENAEKALESAQKTAEKTKETNDRAITEYNNRIKKWENGENKVDLSEMGALANEIIRETA